MTERFLASHRDLRARDSSAMLEAIGQAQARFIVEAESRESFGDLLDILLSITGSEYGFIGEVFQEIDGAPYLKTHSITNIAWNEETPAFYEKYTAEEGMEFRNGCYDCHTAGSFPPRLRAVKDETAAARQYH